MLGGVQHVWLLVGHYQTQAQTQMTAGWNHQSILAGNNIESINEQLPADTSNINNINNINAISNHNLPIANQPSSGLCPYRLRPVGNPQPWKAEIQTQGSRWMAWNAKWEGVPHQGSQGTWVSQGSWETRMFPINTATWLPHSPPIRHHLLWTLPT